MTITEPVTLLTDYVLSGVTGWLAWRLWIASEAQASRRLWSAAFGALAAAALAGGSHHGLALLLPAPLLAGLWKATLFSVGAASFAMLCGSSVALATGRMRKLLLAAAALKLMLYWAWMIGHDDYLYVIADTGAAMLAIAALHLGSWWRRNDAASRWMLGAIVVSGLAAGAQAGGLALHPHFNHNDLYHVIQVAAMVLFYRGARLLRDRTATAP